LGGELDPEAEAWGEHGRSRKARLSFHPKEIIQITNKVRIKVDVSGAMRMTVLLDPRRAAIR
jgi:hypothetical protein